MLIVDAYVFIQTYGAIVVVEIIALGGKIKLFIPAELAYGPRGAGRDIGPNEALEFEVELLSVSPYTEPAAAEAVTE